MKTAKLSELIRPQFDLFTGGAYAGNHHDLFIKYIRVGDKITEHVAWVRGHSGHFMNRTSSCHKVEDILDFAKEWGLSVEDDVPQGLSFPQ
jgi:hypothetical protein